MSILMFLAIQLAAEKAPVAAGRANTVDGRCASSRERVRLSASASQGGRGLRFENLDPTTSELGGRLGAYGTDFDETHRRGAPAPCNSAGCGSHSDRRRSRL